jgi:hypothetical protein
VPLHAPAFTAETKASVANDAKGDSMTYILVVIYITGVVHYGPRFPTEAACLAFLDNYGYEGGAPSAYCAPIRS